MGEGGSTDGSAKKRSGKRWEKERYRKTTEEEVEEDKKCEVET